MAIKSPNETVLYVAIRALKFTGFWKPQHWESGLKTFYKVFTTVMFVVLITIASFVIIAVIRMPTSAPTFLENVFLMFALINANFKAINLIASRDSIIEMLDITQEDSWKISKTEEEKKVRDSYNKTIR